MRCLTVTTLTIVLACALCVRPSQSRADEPLASWNDGETKRAIIEFVERTTDVNSPDFVPASHRIATTDNDGCLWCEQPLYFQALFAFDRIKQLAPQHPEWKEEEPFASVIKDDVGAAFAGGKEALLKLVMASHAGQSAEEFEQSARDWLATARHPTTGKPFTSMIYQPMLELINYLKQNDFKVFIVSGGGIDFLRVFSEDVYGIPRERVVGSSINAKYEVRGGRPVIMKLPSIDLIDDHEGKPVGIHRYIGRRPILAMGNSDGDFEMLQYTTGGDGLRMGLLVHHDDAEREWAYDRESSIGRLDRGLDEAPKRGWKIVSMKDDWNAIYPNED